VSVGGNKVEEGGSVMVEASEYVMRCRAKV
jgi:hypothetical protein